MVAFTSKVDIGNRALQHCGADRMGADGFSENSKRAREVSFAYDKVREAELQGHVWTFATRRAWLRAIDANTMEISASLWSASVTYFLGMIVADQNGSLWISRIANNLNNDPLLTNYWEPYFGPITVSLYDPTAAYSTGELVYTYPGDGTFRVYLSRIDGNSDNPAIATAWDGTVTYDKDKIVTYSSVAYKSLIDLNLNNQPNLTPSAWLIGTTYAAGQKVSATNGYIYQSVGSGNVGIDPTTDDGSHWTILAQTPWTTSFVGGSGSVNWLQIGGVEFPSGVGLVTPAIVYPVGTGPSSQASSQNVYRLPAGYLRLAPQNPKVAVPILGAPTGINYNDWNVENGYIVTSDAGPIRLRFVGDVTDVTRMPSLFCEAIAAHLGMEICQPVTQSDARLQTIAGKYKKYLDDAGRANAIEDGYEDPPDDTFIAVRA